MKTELHIHTRYSHDSLLCINLIGLICKIKGINCVAICDHNTISGGITAQKVLPRFGIEVIVGEEIFTKSGEIIGLFLSSNIPAGLSASATVHEIKKQGGLVYIPHPYDEKRYKTVISREALIDIAEFVDLIEIHNGRNITPRFSEMQKEIAQNYMNKQKTVFVCGSDAHIFFELGRNYIISEKINCNNPALFKETLMSSKMLTAKNQSVSHKITKIIRLIKLIVNGDINELFGIISRKCKKRNNKAC